MKRTMTVLAAAAVLAGASGCSLQQATSADTATIPTVKPAEVRSALSSIPVRPEGSMGGYERDEFGVWADHGDDCDTRAVLLKQTSSTPVRANEYCTVKEGQWVGAYTGRTFTDASKVEVDHLIPLAEAWRSGANSWPEDLRERFGNDLQHGNLVVAEGSTNGDKSDQDPSAWLPSHDRCGYITDYVQVTAYWNRQAQHSGHALTIDPDEKQAIQRELDRCAGGER